MKQFLCGIAAVALVAAVGIKIILTVVGFAIFLLMALSGVVTTGDSKPKPPSPLPPNRHRRDPRRLPLPILAGALALAGCGGALFNQTRASLPTLASRNTTASFTSVGGVINTAEVDSPTGQELFRSCLLAFRVNPDTPLDAGAPTPTEISVRAACAAYVHQGGTAAAFEALIVASGAQWQNTFMNTYGGGAVFGGAPMGYNYGGGMFGNGRFRKESE